MVTIEEVEGQNRFLYLSHSFLFFNGNQFLYVTNLFKNGKQADNELRRYFLFLFLW